MIQTVRITSKNQITIPVAFVKSMNLKKGDVITLSLEDKEIVMRSPREILKSLAGSITLPKKYQGMDLDEVIEKAKGEYFSKKYGKPLR